jgi:lipopolysaccharide transport system permease protein
VSVGETTVGASPDRPPVTVIKPTRGWASLNLGDLWRYRDLLVILAGRDVKLRYKQTILGVAWVILQPLVTALIFTVVFGNFAKLPSDGVPYMLFTFAGLLPWNLFSQSLQRAGNSLVGSSQMISKVYFPRMAIPLASTGSVLIDFLVSLVVFVVLMVVFQVTPTWRILTLPFFLLLALVTAVGVSLWLSALSVYYRDFMFAMPFVIQAWMYASPVAYAASVVPEKWRLLYSLNPAIGFVEGFRWALLGGAGPLTVQMVLVSALGAIVAFVSGAFVFRRIERGFADVI